MRDAAKRKGLAGATGLALLAAVIALAAWIGTSAGDNPAEANHQLILGIDANSTGNTALALGTTEACRVLTNTNAFNVDIYLKGIDDIAAFDIYLKYDTTKITLTKPGASNQGNNALFMLQQAQPTPPGNNFSNLSDPLPDTDGIYNLAGYDGVVIVGKEDPDPIGHTHKDGVLVRLEIQAKSSFVTFPGQSTTLQLTPFLHPTLQQFVGPNITDSFGNPAGDYNGDPDHFVDTVVNATLVSSGGTCSDTDGDGVPDSSDNCPTVSNPTQTNSDGDSQGDACDIDDDNDGLVDTSEPGGCSTDPDCDNDNVSDGPNDPDGGGPIVAGPDNCIQAANTNQLNTDGDALGDACDPDDDNDTILDGADNCPLVVNPSQANMDGDSMGDACDPEDDGDGFDDTAEAYLGTNSMDNCGSHTATSPIQSQAWPADLNSASGLIPDTRNKVNILDLASYVAPVRYLNTDVGTNPGDLRWDIVPGSGIFSNDINIQDLGVLVTFKPLMFGGVDRAFNYPTACTP